MNNEKDTMEIISKVDSNNVSTEVQLSHVITNDFLSEMVHHSTS